MEERRKDISQSESRSTQLRIFGTDADKPDEGRIFAWTKSGWFQRIEGQSGDVTFTPVAKSEDELREFISRDDPSSDLFPLSGEYRKMVSAEFAEQSAQYRDSPQYSDEESSEENDQQYHQHE